MELKDRKPIIFCVCGKAKSGKSLVGEFLISEYKKKGYKVISSPYTKYLKQYIYQITGIEVTDDKKPRDLLQKLSSELIKGKLNNKEFFINRQLEDIHIYSYFFDVIVIPDVRFPKEIEILKNNFDNVVSIGIVRDNYDDGLTLEQRNDITEVALDNYNNYDYVIKNDNKNELLEEVVYIINDIKKEDFYE